MNFETTRASWDKVAVAYTEQSPRFTDDPSDQKALDAFAELVSGRVADIGCGPGQTTAYLTDRGVDVFGVDLSPGMLAVAREHHPDLRFVEGSMIALDIPDGDLGGILSWYSIVNIPPATLPDVFAEFHRVLAPGGHLLLAFRFGDNDVQHYDEGFGHEVSLDFYRHEAGAVAEKLRVAGFELVSRQLRDPDEILKIPQAILVVRSIPLSS